MVTQLNRLKNMGLEDESSSGEKTTALAVEEDAVSPSSMLESSRRPGKEPIRVDDGAEGKVGTPLDQMKNGVGAGGAAVQGDLGGECWGDLGEEG
ncbi:uncharacterized protein A4U43_C04F8260 [Asparagus officinalis]|uniref:Uncharacterized protein n=1 Tax=Asparagus officinalis TaxID=4686 RepID=A0A5P1F4L8_ASPOF|nr:uncharacterized protein A4U43_C04F8260 [Asparagus officinalis]